jgi:bacterioferritin (cytochrome b1)
MDGQVGALNRVLRCELTAVNQQFIHVLALREWGEADIAARIMEVDRVDFPNAMRILDFLVGSGAPLELAPDCFEPGCDVTGILRAERVVERRLSAAIAGARVVGQRPQFLLATAQEPRQAYAEWLDKRLSDGAPNDAATPRTDTGAADLVAHLIAMVEQTLVHAFVHRHAGEIDNADAAWAASGGAMMQLTEMVRLHAASRCVPVLGKFPALLISFRSEACLDSDRRLAALVGEQAAKAAGECEWAELGYLCRKIPDYSLEQSRWSPGQAHPAARTNPPAFASFAATLKRFDVAA